MDISQFDYDLPEELIAQTPTKNRTDARLLYVADRLQDLYFKDVLNLLKPTDLLITNNTRVIAARLFGQKPTGGRVEIMLERVTDEHTAIAQLKSSKSLVAGQIITVDRDLEITVLGRADQFYILKFAGMSVEAALQAYGHLPLPPYIRRIPDQADYCRYQTVYAKRSGAVAAPTAGLHFDQGLFKQIKAAGITCCEVTLHVGAGTFQPVRVQQIDRHKMHSETYQIDAETILNIQRTRRQGGRIVAVGTTTVRALESAYLMNGLKQAVEDQTDLFIYPGFKFRAVDVLVTNFHLPKSSLLMMVSAFAGYEKIMQAYRHAVESRYRFFSYGDAMFLTRQAYRKNN